jgi:serine/threonine protein kinase
MAEEPAKEHHEGVLRAFTANGRFPPAPERLETSPRPRVPHHEILGFIGVGSDGDVWRAKHRLLGTDVAVKVLRASKDSENLSRFFGEVRVARTLSSRHLVAIHDVGLTDDCSPFFTMTLFEGSLKDRLKQNKLLTPAEVARVLLHLGSAVTHLHGSGETHRDIKPGNILYRRASGSTIWVLSDFGLATGDFRIGAGTFPYTAPELLTVDGRPSEASDLYAFARLVDESVANSTIQVATRIAMRAVTEPCLERDPANRRGSVASVVLELLDHLGEAV